MQTNEKPVAIVTGAGRGIGRAAAVELGRRGWRVVLVSRTETDLRETARLCGDGRVIVADVGQSAGVEQVVGRAVEQFGRIDAAVHCAGLAPMRSVEETTDAQWRHVIDVNLSAAFYLARALWPVFRKGGGGVLVNLSSYAARDPFPGFSAYAAAKAGVNLLGWSLAAEGHPHNIRVHTIAPAAVETPMFRTLRTVEQVPTERTLRPEDVAGMIAGCVCGELRYTSGEVIYMSRTR